MNERLKLYLGYGVMNLVMALLLFSALFFLTYYMQEEPASHLVDSDPGFDSARYGYGPASGFDVARYRP